MPSLGYYGPGNLFGLPELGISEMFGGNKQSLSDATVKQSTGQDPNMSVNPNPIYNPISAGFGFGQYAANQIANSGSSQGGDALGASTGGTPQYGSTPNPDTSSYSKSGTAESLGLSTSDFENMASNAGFDSTENFINSGILDEINSSFSGTMNYLSGLENQLKGQLPGSQADVNSLIGESQNLLQQQANAADNNFNLQGQQAEGRRQDALTDAVRLYNELSRGGQQRFGGASSASEAYQAIAGQQLQRNRQQVSSQFEGFMQQAAVAKQNLEQQIAVTAQNLESQRIRMQNDVMREFQNKLQEINMLKAEAEDSKAQLRLSALQDLRNQQFQIQLQTEQQKQAAAQEAQQYTTQLNQAIQQQAAAMNQSLQGVSPKATQSFAFNPSTQGGMSVVPGTTLPTGFINPDDENQLVGSISPANNDEQFLG